MKKLLGLLVAFFLLLPAQSLAQDVPERIDSFNTYLTVDKTGGVKVEEVIVYNFGSLTRHGIYRDIPYSYEGKGGNFNLRIKDVEVKDEFGRDYNFTKTKSGGYIKLKVGDKDIEVTGRKTYRIFYSVDRAINYFNDHDELYWNSTGNEWVVPIDKAYTRVNVEGVTGEQFKIACYTGGFGSTENNCKTTSLNGAAQIDSTRAFGTQEGLTVVVGWPKGIVAEASMLQKAIWIAQDNWSVLLPFIAFFIVFRIWKKYGKDPKLKTIVAEYDPPSNLTPIELAMLASTSSTSMKSIPAQLIYLATQGYLKISKVKKDGLFMDSDDYILERLNSGNEQTPEDKKLLDSIFDIGNTKNLDDLKKDPAIGRAILEAAHGYSERFEKLGMFVKYSRGLRILFIILAFIFTGFAFIGFASGEIIFAISLFTTAIIVFIFGLIMPSRTKEGAEVYRKLLGFKEYIEVAEKDRIAFHDAPEKSPERFQKLLPFAMMLGMEKQWGKIFEGINVSPSWYKDSTSASFASGFNSVAFANSVNSFGTSVSSNIVTASSGGSGFSGGGSGGGGGGGGGGSW